MIVEVEALERALLKDKTLRELSKEELVAYVQERRKDFDVIVGSISLGSSSRDKMVRVRIEDINALLFRKGTDGDFRLAGDMIEELDGLLDAIGLGGIDLYIRVGDEVFEIEDALYLKNRASKSLVVDGSRIKNTLEREVIRELTQRGIISPPMKVLMVSAVDRWGMAETFWELGYRCLFGDLIFSFGINRPISSLDELKKLGSYVLKYAVKLPFELLYPVGEKQKERKPYTGPLSVYYEVADIIAGDFHYVIKYMPPKLPGKVIITNTLTQQDAKDLKARGVKMIITTTPKLGGRSFGTNLLEGLISSIALKRWGRYPEDDQEILYLIKELELSYSII